MGLQQLPDIHTRRHTQWVEHDIDRSAISQEGHIFLGNDFGDNTFVVTSCHFVADRKLAFGSNEDLHRFDDPRFKVISRFNAFHFLIMLHLQIVKALFVGTDDLVDFVTNGRWIDLDTIVNTGEFSQQGFGNLAVGRNNDFTCF